MFTPEDTAAYYRKPSGEDTARLLQFRHVVAQVANTDGSLRPARTIGYLEVTEGILEGSRNRHVITYIWDADQRRVGVIVDPPSPPTVARAHTDEERDAQRGVLHGTGEAAHGGNFYRYGPSGSAEFVTSDELLRGLRAFFNLPAQTVLTVPTRDQGPDEYNDYGKFPRAAPTAAPPPANP